MPEGRNLRCRGCRVFGLGVQPFEGVRRCFPHVFFLVIDRAPLECDGGIGTANFPQCDRRGDPHVFR